MAPRPRPYEILGGLPDGVTVWLEAVYGLGFARRRMREIARQKPGVYFIRNENQMVLDGINTAPDPARPEHAGVATKRTAA